ncbi:MAG: hypothetical protein R3B13_23005 [Polyangiaceae bacterium]
MKIAERARQMVGLLRATQAGATAENRAQTRNVRIMLTAVSLAATQATTILVGLVTVPIALGYLGAERYGLWLSVTSVMALLRFADFGIGNGLINTLAQAHGEGNAEDSRTYVSSGFFMLLALGLVGLGVFLLLYPWVDWSAAFAVKTAVAQREAGPTMLVLIVCVAANLPAGVVQRLQVARQSEYLANAWTIAGTLVGLIGVVLCARAGASLPWLVFSATGAAVGASLCNGLFEFVRRSPELRPRVSLVSVRHARELFRVGMLFVLIQIMGIALIAGDNLILSHLMGPEFVPVYAVPFRLFQIAPLLATFVLRPMWPAYAEARARGDVGWIRATFTRSVWITLGASIPLAAVLVWAAPWILTMWVGAGTLGPTDRLLLIALGAWSVLASVGGALSMFMNGMDLVRFQAYAGAVTGVAALTLKIVLTRTLGVSGVVWGMVIAQALFMLLPAAFAIRTRLRAG